MNDSHQGQWNPPQQGGPMGMAGNVEPMDGPNGQMGGPMMGGPMGPPGNMMQQYEGWGTNSLTGGYAGYSTQYNAQGPSAPPGPPLHQRGSSYNFQPTATTQGYGSYGGPAAAASGGYGPTADTGEAVGGEPGCSWWSSCNMPQNGTELPPPQPNSLQPNSNSCPSGPQGFTTDEEYFNDNNFHQALRPTLKKLYAQNPESEPFQQPVDTNTFKNYLQFVKKPMDLSTIKRKLDGRRYKSPWEYIDDTYLMFENAWLYNAQNTHVYEYCTKLSEVFEQEIDPVMKKMGYCCGRKHRFNLQVLYCYSKQCAIKKDAKYFSFQNNRYTFCQKCFKNIPGDTVTLRDDPTQTQITINKERFQKMKNDHLELEPFVTCTNCGRRVHQICVLHIEPIEFTCDNCLKKKGQPRKENKLKAKRLPETKLGTYIETRVNNFLKKKVGVGEIAIRVLDCRDKVFARGAFKRSPDSRLVCILGGSKDQEGQSSHEFYLAISEIASDKRLTVSLPDVLVVASWRPVLPVVLESGSCAAG